jgi:hypothetical protein
MTLIKSTISNLQTYYFSLFHILVGVANRIKKFQRDFIWSGLGDEFKFRLVKWSKICTAVKSGGLGVKNLIQFNRPLLGSGCGGMLQRGRLCGDRWGILSMVV